MDERGCREGERLASLHTCQVTIVPSFGTLLDA
jgi:hypothetical protein